MARGTETQSHHGGLGMQVGDQEGVSPRAACMQAAPRPTGPVVRTPRGSERTVRRASRVLQNPEEGSPKRRLQQGQDEPEDHGLDVWAGGLPISVTFGEPQPDPLLREEIPLPAHIRDRVGN